MHYEKLKDPFIDAETDFWIGDPCYVVPDSNWPHLCHNWSAYEKQQEELGNELPKCYVAEVQHEPTQIPRVRALLDLFQFLDPFSVVVQLFRLDIFSVV